MTPAEVKDKVEALRAAVAEGVLVVHQDMLDSLRADGDIEDYQKYLVWASKVLGAEADKDDKRASLPMVNIVIGMDGHIAVEKAKPMEIVEEVAPEPIPLPPPVPLDDLDDGFEVDLDELLGVPRES